jgi:hypothetical protein
MTGANVTLVPPERFIRRVDRIRRRAGPPIQEERADAAAGQSPPFVTTTSAGL